MSNGYLTTCALIISSIITIVLFSKKTINNMETKLFKKMLLLNVFESLITTLIVLVALTSNSLVIFKVLNRIDVNLIIWWCSYFLLYIAYVCKIKNLRKISRYIFCVNLIFLVFSIFLDVNIIAMNGILNSSGPLTNVCLIISVVYILIMLILVLLFIKNKLNKNKFLPFYFLIFILVLIAFLRIIIPEINFISIMIALVDLIMIFTIENPDLKLLEEIEFNKKIIEKNNEEKSNLLFKISQDVRVPIKEIENKSIELLNVKNKKDIKSLVRDINSESKNLSFIVDNILNINTFDVNKIKLYNTKFNIYNLCDEIKLIIKNKNNKNVKFDFNIYNEIPLLYGDGVRLKQLICSLINYSLIYNESSYVFLDISGLLRYDICRLIINIKDNGKNISVDKINNILNDNINVDKVNLNIDDLNLEIESINKVIKLLNGTFFIKSNKTLGNDYSIVIDYEVADKTFMLNFSNTFFAKKKVLLINDNTEELKKYSKLLKSKGIDVTTGMFGKDCIDKIKYGEVYDLILIDDEMQPYNAIETYNELKKDINFKTKVIIMLGLNKEFIKEHYIRDYKFSDYLIKRSYEKELDRIIDKYL